MKMKSSRRIQFIWALFVAGAVLLAFGSPYGFFFSAAAFWIGIGLFAYSLDRSRSNFSSNPVLLVMVALPVPLLLAVMPLTTFPRVIEGSAMDPVLQGSDRVLSIRYSTTFINPGRGDLVVFSPPTGQDVDTVKRIIGVPGDEIELDGEAVFVNGEKTDWVAGSTPIRRFFDYPVTVPPGEYFVLGDNRRASVDSRNWGFVSEDDLHGRATILYTPINRFRIFH
jgi:signal peptidase I